MGRVKGSKNKVTRELKEMILTALDHAGGKDGGIGYLVKQANDNPSSFLALVGKIIPLTVAGDQNNPVRMLIMELGGNTFAPVPDDDTE
jgi:hypothetical protein